MGMNALHPLEHRILAVLGRDDSVGDISEKTGLKKDEVMRALQWLKTKGLISMSEQVTKEVRITPMGRSYMREGLPETRFLKMLPATVDELRSKLSPQEFNVSMGALGKEDKIKLDNGRIVLTAEGKKHLAEKKWEKFLADAGGKDYSSLSSEDAKIADSLKRRNIIEILLRRTWKASILAAGREAVSTLFRASSASTTECSQQAHGKERPSGRTT